MTALNDRKDTTRVTRWPFPEWFIRSDGEDCSNGPHGVGHCTRVGVLAMDLAAALQLPDWQVDAAIIAGLWHDIGREKDGADHQHGLRGAKKALGLGLDRGIAPPMLRAALLAVAFHDVADELGEKAAAGESDPAAALSVLRVLKDANTLDRVRFGPDGLDIGQLRFRESHELFAKAVELTLEVT